MPVKSSSTTGEWDAQTDIEPVHRLVCIPPHNRTLSGSFRDEIEELSDTFQNGLTFRRVISEELGHGPGRSSTPTRLDVTSSMEEYQAFTQARLSEARMIGQAIGNLCLQGISTGNAQPSEHVETLYGTISEFHKDYPSLAERLVEAVPMCAMWKYDDDLDTAFKAMEDGGTEDAGG
ncbi:hypothetical protein I317_05980 [Kwoniella heveanensis CBS 569]|nr:hypothetical protein I317_05980 [Kwoniella heveanensis CBS 569]